MSSGDHARSVSCIVAASHNGYLRLGMPMYVAFLQNGACEAVTKAFEEKFHGVALCPRMLARALRLVQCRLIDASDGPRQNPSCYTVTRNEVLFILHGKAPERINAQALRE